MAAGGESTSDEKSKEVVEGFFTNEIIKTIVESIGYDKPVDEVLQYLSENVTFLIKEIVQEATKFQHKSKRKKLKSCDVDNALRVKNIQPVYGFSCSSFIPFRYASGGGRELYFQEDEEVDLDEIMTQNVPKAPLEVTLKSHWLAIDGVQPAIPENPPPISRDTQIKETAQPFSKGVHVNEVKVDGLSNEEKSVANSKESRKEKKKLEELKKINSVKTDDKLKLEEAKFKPLVTHELSVEQQIYYKEITEACVGSNETKRMEALQSLASDPGLYQLLPRFITFISEGVRINVAQYNLALLIYLLRMSKSLMENSTLYLDKYLHELIPAVITCIVSKQLCPRPDFDNHWALRDFAAKLLAQICKHFSTPTNNIQSRATKTLCKSLFDDESPLVTHYGAVAGLGELGLEAIKFFILPRLKKEGEFIQKALEGNTSDKIAAEKLQARLIKDCAHALLKTRPPPDLHANYIDEFGYLGNTICTKVMHFRIVQQQGGAGPKTPLTPTIKTEKI